jgi:hypothetical protein
MAALLRARLGDLGMQESPGWFEERRADGQCVVLLNGLDEVAQQGDRAKVFA